jgi:hypothetical protein
MGYYISYLGVVRFTAVPIVYEPISIGSIGFPRLAIGGSHDRPRPL